MADNHLKIRIDAEGADAKAVIGQVRRQLDGLGDEAEKAAEKAGRSFSRMDGQMGSTAAMMGSLRRQFMGLLAIIGAGGLARSVIETSNAFTQYRMTLDTLEGSHEAAEAKWQQLLEFAEQTPFKINEVMQAYKTMKAYGLDPSIEAMRALGDASAVLGGDTFQRISYALGQMHSAGRLLGQDMRQLTEAGINVKQVLKEAFGTADLDRLNARIASGAIRMRQVYDAFLQYMKDHFGGQMKRLNNTLAGQWEVLISLWQELSDSLMNKGGAADSLTAVLKIFNDWFRALVKDKGAMAQLGEAINSMVGGAMKGFYGLKAAAHLVEGAFNGIMAAVYKSMEWLERKIAEFLFSAGQAAKALHFDDMAKGFFESSVEMANEAENSLKSFTEASQAASQAMKAYEKDFEDMANVEGLIAKYRKDMEEARKAASSGHKVTDQEKNDLIQTTKLLDKKTRKIKEAYDAAMAFIQVHEQTDKVAMQLERVKKQYEELEDAIWAAFDAEVIGADEAWQAMERLSRAQENDTARISKAHKTAAQEVSKGWENAYNQITNFLEDWISGSKSLVASFIDWLKRALAQIAATSIVGSIAGGLGLPGAAAWAGQGGVSLSGAAGAVGTAGSLWDKIQAAGGVGSWLLGGLTGAGNTLMYGVPETLLSMGFEDTAFMLGSMPSSLMGGLTAGLGTFLMNGLLSGDWASAAVSGGTTGIGAGVGALAGGPIGAVIGGLLGAIGGNLLGGIFGDGTERTYLQQAMTTSYGPGGFTWGEPRTRRWDRGKPDWMDQILDIQGQLEEQLKGVFDGMVDTLSKLTPELKDQLKGWSGDFLMSWSAETKDEVQEDLEKNVKNFAKYELAPVIETFKEDLKQGISGPDLSLFTDEVKKGFTDHIQQLMDELDFSSIDSIEELEDALEQLGATVDEIQQMENYVQKVHDIQQQFADTVNPADAYHRQLKKINKDFEDTRQSLVDMGVDLEKMPELYQAWAKAIDDLKMQVFGFILDVPEKFDEQWIGIIHDISQLDLGGKMVDLLNQALDDPSKLENVGQEWATWLVDSMKSSVMSGAMDFLMDQVKTAFIQPIIQTMINEPFGAGGIAAAFGQMEDAMPKLAEAGQSMAEVFDYMQQNGGLQGFDWDTWNDKYGALWDEINQANEKAAKAHEDAAAALKGSAESLKAAADRIQQPPDVNVVVNVSAPEANLD